VLEKFIKFANEVYGLAGYAKRIRDNKKRRTIKTGVVVYLLIFSFCLNTSSFHRMRYMLELNRTRFRNLLPKGTRLPKIDAIRETVKAMNMEDVKEMHNGIVDRIVENKVLRENTINGLRVVAVDGTEFFSSKVKRCEDCLTREVKGEVEHFHKAVVCMTVGRDPHIALGIETLNPKSDGSGKDEGEMTGVKRLLRNLRKRHHHFADVVVADALYMNAPFINLVKEMGMHSVIRAKDTRLNIVKDALGLFAHRTADHEFSDTKARVLVWDDNNFHMEGTNESIRFLKFEEHWERAKGKQVQREAWCITTLGKEISAHTIWLIMHKRWDIENNGFRMLKTYFHADHCYVHGKGANEKVLLFILIAFNLMELFLFRRLKKFRELKMLRIDVVTAMYDHLLLENYSAYFNTG
jgi:hypothetical protein